MRRFLAGLGFAWFVLVAGQIPAFAQDREASSDGQPPIIIERIVTGEDGRPVERPSNRKSPPGRLGMVNQEDEIDFGAAGLARRFDTNNPVARYGHAGEMAECVLASVGNGAASYVSTEFETEYETLWKAYRGRHLHCVNSAERGAPIMMVNAALAELLVVRNVDQPPLRAAAVDSGRAWSFIQGPEGVSHIATVGRCIVALSPGYAYDVLFTTPGYPDEREALDRAYSNSPECGLTERPKGRMSTIYQRMALTMALFNWYDVSSMAGASKS